MLIVIGGPTGSGKSEVCCALAKRIGAEIISADSMCVYRHMNIGTSKPLECIKEIKHHLVDVVEPGQVFDAKIFEKMALDAIDKAQKVGKAIIVCGGTYLYLQALLYGIEDTPEPDWSLRNRLYMLAQQKGSQYLHQKLRIVDPIYALKVSPRDTRRIVRALEVFINSGKSFSSFHRWNRPRSEFAGFYLHWSWESLSLRIEERAKSMLNAGLLQELRGLMGMGFESFITSTQAIGYKEFIPYLKGSKSLEECFGEMVRNTKEYAKRQIRWFNRQSWTKIDMERLGVEGAVEEILKSLDIRPSQNH
ncbi:MAG: tRNA (adenosine(37)-N6)-dimethylallyltransferase MiaA [Aquificaceae bacterium]|nr:tRNA (adenosine(37)-N6)-dimethylallyltransferase MiaA [Aquificaceae bacterium]MCX8163847.1 tRNA (adenosine(37)-N6)-dimethylallyltransferase MiaA [Aquificaceae bacterium]